MANTGYSPLHRAEQAEQQAHQAAISPQMQFLARFGYVAKGIVYLIVGGLAAKLAAGTSTRSPDRNGAIQFIAAQPFGKVLLFIVMAGLVIFALWSLIQAVFDPEHKGTQPKGLIERIGYAVVAFSYGGLAAGALSLAVGSGNGGKDSNATTQGWTARLLDLPLGVALVVIVGLIVLGVACVLLYKNTYKARFRQRLTLATLRSQVQRAIVFMGRFGYGALAVVFVLIGIFLIVAAFQHNPGQAKGLDGALQTLVQQPFGQALLGVVAAGLIAYGLYSFVEARYRRLAGA